ncbi:hypothetical protein R6Y95_06125 [Methanoculleus palmolei]|uniref:Uncharacterized protein n=1 Tax=Methanoculleus palmolei TaxID=72612 RepID=A0ABD8A699_9EURY|nr:hypothetical protein R6Y95_06125 [Methanoculleus palmolei]
MTVSGAGDYTQKLRDRASSMVKEADMMLAIADAIDAVTTVCDKKRISCFGPCKRCPAYIGHPGLCLFMQLQYVVDRLKEWPNPSPIIEVP